MEDILAQRGTAARLPPPSADGSAPPPSLLPPGPGPGGIERVSSVLEGGAEAVYECVFSDGASAVRVGPALLDRV